MPAIETGGFQVQIPERMRYYAPERMVPKYSDILPEMEKGTKYAQLLSQIAEEKRLAPMNKRLAEIKLAQAEADLQAGPLNLQIKKAHLAQLAAAPVTNITGTGLRSVPRLTQMIDPETDQPMFNADNTPRMENIAGADDQFKTEQGTSTDLLTGKSTSFDRNSGLFKSGEQVMQEQALLESTQASTAKKQQEDNDDLELVNAYQEAKAAGNEERADLILEQLKLRKAGVRGSSGNLVTDSMMTNRLHAKQIVEAHLSAEVGHALTLTNEGAQVLGKLAKIRKLEGTKAWDYMEESEKKLSPEENKVYAEAKKAEVFVPPVTRRDLGGGIKSPFRSQILAPEDTPAQEADAMPVNLTVPSRPTPSNAAVEYLKIHPENAAEFDKKFGMGLAAKILGTKDA